MTLITQKSLVSSLITLFYLSFCNFAQSQQATITPTSPEAATLSKFVNFPVSLNTGVPDIHIPLYQIESGGINLPIGISYHAGGFKINEQSTSVGLGWALDCDLQITRTINGMDDFTPGNGYIANSNIKTYYENGSCPGCYFPFGNTYFNDYAVASGSIDPAPDRFNYRLAGKSGSFFFVKNNAGTGYHILPVPYDDIQIQYNNGQFIITDVDGTVYYFGTPGPKSAGTGASLGFEYTGQMSSVDGTCLNCVVTTWKCKKIQNATNTSTVTFSYAPKTITQNSYTPESIEYYNNPLPCSIQGGYVGNVPIVVSPSVTTLTDLFNDYKFVALSSPKWMENTIGGPVFHLPNVTITQSGTVNISDRTFTGGTVFGGGSGGNVAGLAISQITFPGGSVIFSGTDKLDSINVVNASNQNVKTFAFLQNYTTAFDMTNARTYNGQNWNGTLYLDSLQIKNNSGIFERYLFLYNKFCFGSHLKGHDAWGFSNAHTTEISGSAIQSPIPIQHITQTCYPNCNPVTATFTVGESDNAEDINQSGPLNGILTRIVYPTGGYTTFDYENNMYAQTAGFTNAQPAITAGGLRIRSIDYFDGKANKLVSQKYYRYGELEDGIGLLVNNPPRTFNSGKLAFDAFHFNQTVNYLSGPTTAPGNGTVVFTPIPANCSNASCLSALVTENKTTYWPTSALDDTYPDGAPIYYTKVTEYNQDLGGVTGKKVYHFYKPDAFVPTSFAYMNILYGTNVSQIKSAGFMGMESAEDDYKFENNLYTLIHRKEFDYIKFEISTQPDVVYSFLRNTYQLGVGPYSGTTQGLYDISTSGAFQGRSQDYQSGEYGIKVGKLLLSAEREKWYNGADSVVSGISYAYNNGNYTQPTSIVTTGSNGHQVMQTIKYAYDFAGTPIYDQMKAQNMISQKIEVVNFDNTSNVEISHSKINYANFTSGLGFIAPSTRQTSVKGNTLENEVTYNSYDQNANVTQLTGRDGITKSYLWGYNFQYPVAEIVGATYATVTSNINVATLQSITDDATLRATLSNLRAALPSAMMTSFTYKPLTGVSSQTAPNGLNKYYEYDNIGRLSLVRDHNQNIVKKWDYHETGPTTSLATTMLNVSVPVMASFSSACGPPNTYKTWNFTEPGGRILEPVGSPTNLDAESELYQAEGPLSGSAIPCPPAGQTAGISLTAFMYTGSAIPGYVYLDLFQNHSIVGSQRFPASTTNNTFYIPSGQYQLGLRMNTNYNLSIVEYYVQPSSGSGYYVKPGGTVSFTAGLSYTITVSNALIP